MLTKVVENILKSCHYSFTEGELEFHPRNSFKNLKEIPYKKLTWINFI